MLELLQLPPDVPLLVKVAVKVIHNGLVPLIVPAVTFGLTVNVLTDDTGAPQPELTK